MLGYFKAVAKNFLQIYIIFVVCYPGKLLATFSDVGAMLEALRPTAAVNAPELNTLIIALDGLPTAQQRLNALHTLAPVADGSLRAASTGTMRQFVSILHDRLLPVVLDETSQTTSNAQQGKSFGDVPGKTNFSDNEPATDTANASQEEQAEKVLKGAWIHIIANDISQKMRGQVPGYDGQTVGGFIGRDWLIAPCLSLGVAAGYQQVDVDSRGPSGSYLDIKRFQGSIYGRYDFVLPFYVQGALTVASNQYDNNRKILVPPAGGVANFVRIGHGDFSGFETDINTELGFEWQIGEFYIVPKMMLAYNLIDFNSYVEQDAFGLNLNVEYEDMDALLLGAGLEIKYHHKFPKAYVIPKAFVNVIHDFISDTQRSTANMLGGGFSFLTVGEKPAETSFEAGVSLEVHSYKQILFTVQYDYAGQQDYHRHQGMIKVRYEWL